MTKYTETTGEVGTPQSGLKTIRAYNTSRSLGTDESGRWQYRPVAMVSYRPGSIVYNRDQFGNEEISAKIHGRHDTLFDINLPKVEELWADDSMKAHVPTLLGHVLQHANQLGTKIQAPDSLSTESSRIVRRGMAAGLVAGDPANPKGRRTNWVTESREDGGTSYVLLDRPAFGKVEIPESKVAEMRKAGREAVVATRGTKNLDSSTKKRTRKKGPIKGQLSFDI